MSERKKCFVEGSLWLACDFLAARVELRHSLINHSFCLVWVRYGQRWVRECVEKLLANRARPKWKGPASGGTLRGRDRLEFSLTLRVKETGMHSIPKSPCVSHLSGVGHAA